MTAHPASRRDQAVLLTGLLVIAALAWWYIVRMALMPMDMDMGMDMPMDMPMPMDGGGTGQDWTGAGYLSLFTMWAVMMVAMMLPSAAPAVLGWRGRIAARQGGGGLGSAGAFVAGYLALWAAFSAGAALVQLLLNRAAWLTPMGASTRPVLAAALLVAAGLYQFSPPKRVCLGFCRVPFPDGGLTGGFGAGVAYGLRCVGCCWLLMALLFVAGVMNLWWVVALAVAVFLERVGPWGRWAERLIGVACFAGAVWVLTR